MDTAWIQVFVLTLSECVAPTGKTICQEREVEMQFVDRQTCEIALERMIWLAEGASDVIISRQRSGCAASAVERTVYETVDAVREQVADADWKAPSGDAPPPDFTEMAHKERLAVLQSCDDTGGRTPCKVGEIIMEGASEQGAEIWRRN